MNENVVNLANEELELTKKLLSAAYEREVFYKEGISGLKLLKNGKQNVVTSR